MLSLKYWLNPIANTAVTGSSCSHWKKLHWAVCELNISIFSLIPYFGSPGGLRVSFLIFLLCSYSDHYFTLPYSVVKIVMRNSKVMSSWFNLCKPIIAKAPSEAVICVSWRCTVAILYSLHVSLPFSDTMFSFKIARLTKKCICCPYGMDDI